MPAGGVPKDAFIINGIGSVPTPSPTKEELLRMIEQLQGKVNHNKDGTITADPAYSDLVDKIRALEECIDQHDEWMKHIDDDINRHVTMLTLMIDVVNELLPSHSIVARLKPEALQLLKDFYEHRRHYVGTKDDTRVIED